MGATCLIPFFNERERIAQVLEIVTKVKNVTQVVCVDDGSTDGTAAYIKEYWPAVKVLRLYRNQGKAAAIRHGLKAAKNETILLMDADLQDIQAGEIYDAISAFKLYQLDMLILRRINSPWFVKWYRSDILLSGERLILKNDLKKILSKQVKRYQLEVAINNYMLHHGKEVRWMPWSALNTYKVDKWGVLGGSHREFKMYVEIVGYVGLINMVLQLTSFATKRLKRSAKSRPVPPVYAEAI